MPATVHLSEVTETRINAEAVKALVSDSTTGAVVLFSGDVRNHDHGRTVISLTYEGHPSSQEVFAAVVNNFAAQSQTTAIAAVHRIGDIPIGEAALVVAVGSSHRGDAFAAAGALVDVIKEELPVWKHQFFSDGSDEWVNCAGVKPLNSWTRMVGCTAICGYHSPIDVHCAAHTACRLISLTGLQMRSYSPPRS